MTTADLSIRRFLQSESPEGRRGRHAEYWNRLFVYLGPLMAVVIVATSRLSWLHFSSRLLCATVVVLEVLRVRGRLPALQTWGGRVVQKKEMTP